MFNYLDNKISCSTTRRDHKWFEHVTKFIYFGTYIINYLDNQISCNSIQYDHKRPQHTRLHFALVHRQHSSRICFCGWQWKNLNINRDVESYAVDEISHTLIYVVLNITVWIIDQFINFTLHFMVTSFHIRLVKVIPCFWWHSNISLATVKTTTWDVLPIHLHEFGHVGWNHAVNTVYKNIINPQINRVQKKNKQLKLWDNMSKRIDSHLKQKW